MQVIAACLIVIGFVLFGCAVHYSRIARREMLDNDEDEPMIVSPYDIPATPASKTGGTFLGLAFIAWMIAILFVILNW